MQQPNTPYYYHPDQYTYNPQSQTPPQPQFYPQNPNPYYQGPPYYQSYPNPNPNPYSQSIEPFSYAAPSADVAGNIDQCYCGDIPGLFDGPGGTVPQDGSQHLEPAIPTYNNWPNQNSTVQPRGRWKKFPKKTKIAQSAWCEICKLECNTKDVLDVHKLGKKHQKVLVKLNSAALVTSISAATHVNPVVPSNPIAQSAWCEICKIDCNTKDVLDEHKLGKKHQKNLVKLNSAALVASIAATTHVNPVAPGNPIAQSAWCEICKIDCNTKDVLDQHKLGKKHQKMLVKLNSAALVVSIPATTHVNPVAVPKNPIIGPPENPNKATSGSKKKAETPQELEMKRRKVMEGGAAASAVRSCSFCNVVCNSDAVFRYHLAGQKHSSMLKKSQQQAAVAGTV